MRRYWIEGASETDSTVDLRGDHFHHICDVCRQAVGSRFEVLTESGWALFVEITEVGKKQASAQVLDKRRVPPLPRPYIHLALSVPKIATFEAVLEKSVELGIYKIWPFFSDYSFVKSGKGIFSAKQERFQKIITGATQQTGRGEKLQLEAPLPLPLLLEKYGKESAARGVFAYEGAGDQGLREALRPTTEVPENLWVFVGSEGGFSTDEVELFKRFNLFPVSLGHQVLRVETACVTLLSIIKYEMNLL